MLHCHVQQCLAVRTRDQHAGTDDNPHRPEIAVTDDISDGFVAQPPFDQRSEALRNAVTRRIEQQIAALNAQRMRKQDFGIETRGGADGR